jgi:hypothetical protein
LAVNAHQISVDLGELASPERAGWGGRRRQGTTRRDRVEAAIGRYKRVIGDGPHSCTDLSRATEVGLAVRALNRIVELGRPHYVRTA